MKVCKFGGTSVSDASALEKVVKRIKEDKERSVIVVSAPGKRSRSDIKLTDELIQFSNALKHRFECFKTDLNEEFKIIEDYILSRGEYLMSKILALKLGYTWVDARDVIKFKSSEAIVDDTKLKPKTVLGGFYGVDEKGSIKTFPRGGGDITGALVAAKLNAKVYENFTDVDGVYKLNKNGQITDIKYDELTYDKLIELAERGMTPVHIDAVKICKKNNIKLIVRNTFSKDEGTVVHG